MTQHAIDREEVMAYVDGELDGARLPEVEAHVSACDECRALVNDLCEVSGRLSGWHVTDAGNGLAGVKHALSGSAGPRGTVPPWWKQRSLLRLPRWAFAGGLALVAALVITPWLGTRRADPLMGMAVEGPTVANREIVAIDPEATASPAVPAPPAPFPAPFPGAQGQGGVAERARVLVQQPQEQYQRNNRRGQPSDRMIIRTARMILTSDRFDQIRAELERLVAAHEGRVTSLNMSGDPSSRRSFHATIGVATAKLDGFLAGVRTLGRVQEESLGSDDVTDSFRDLTLRIANARREEQRLVELLTRRTGDLADVLAVEREIARVRLDIERMEAEMRATEQRVDLATVTLTVREQYRADLAIGPLPLNLRFENAIVDGFRQTVASLVAVALIVLQVAPLFLVWGLILVWPVRWIWRRARAAVNQA